MNEDDYEVYIGRSVRITKIVKKLDGQDKEYFYQGIVTKVSEGKLMLEDKKIGPIIFSFDKIKVIEPLGDEQ